jgi:hypothetical protein
MTRTRVVCFLLLTLSIPAAASAQSERSYWGVAVGWVPEWESHDVVKILFDAERLALTGDEFRIGVARGRMNGGDWSLSYIRKRFDAGSRVIANEAEAFEVTPGQFFTFSEELIVQNAKLDGLEFQKFVAFATIKRRVQIGMNFGVGFAKIDGTVLRRSQDIDFLPPAFAPTPVTRESLEPANSLLVGEIDYLPLGKVELAVGVNAAPGLKVRVSGGFNMPGVPALGATVVYLVGAR